MAQTVVKLTSVELDEDFTYDLPNSVSELNLSQHVGKLFDVTDNLREDDDPTDDDAVFAALQDTLTDLTGLLVAWVEFERV